MRTAHCTSKRGNVKYDFLIPYFYGFFYEVDLCYILIFYNLHRGRKKQRRKRQKEKAFICGLLYFHYFTYSNIKQKSPMFLSYALNIISVVDVEMFKALLKIVHV